MNNNEQCAGVRWLEMQQILMSLMILKSYLMWGKVNYDQKPDDNGKYNISFHIDVDSSVLVHPNFSLP